MGVRDVYGTARKAWRTRLGATVSAAALAAGTAFIALPAMSAGEAAAAETPANETLSFNIPAQDLNAALLAFADKAGIQVFFDVEKVAGLRSSSLSGTHTVSDALGELLEGTGLTYRFTGADAVSLFKPGEGDQAGAVQLDPLLVEGNLMKERARGPVDGIVATRSATGTKTDAALIETPQAINVVTRDQMEEQGVQSVTESLRYTPGVVGQYGDNDVRHDWLTVRGFTPGRYLDGLRLPFGARGYAQPRIETYNLERVEVLKGPASILYGQAAPGGLVNMVSKRPTEETIREVELQTGSHNRAQAAFDFGGKVNEEGTMLFRLVGLGRISDTQFDHVEEEKTFIAPSFTFAPTNETSVTLFGEYQKIDSEGGGGAPALPANGTLYTDVYAKLPRDTFVGEPGYDHFTNEQWFVGYKASHELSDVWTLRQNLRYGEVDVDTQRVQAFCLGACDPSALLRYAWAFPETSEMLTVDTQAIAEFGTGPVEHTFLAGLDYSAEDSTFEETALAPIMTPFNAYDPVYGAVTVTRPPVAMRIDQERDQTGLYAQDQAKIGNLTLMLSGRYDWADTKTRTQNGGGTTNADQEDTAFTWRVGTIYNFENGLAPYVSYSTSFQPASGTDRNGNMFDPTEGEQIEAGVKFQPEGWKSFVTLSAFELTQTNVLTPDPVNTTFRTQTGEVVTKGIELEGKAELQENLSFIASYAYTDSEITKDNPNAGGVSNQGNRLSFVPKHQASGWLDYTFVDGPLTGFGLGGGVRYMGQTFGDNANNFDVPSYTLADAAIRYDLGTLSSSLEGVSAAVNVSNLFDKEYVSTCLSATGCYWGEGRTVYATLKYSW